MGNTDDAMSKVMKIIDKTKNNVGEAVNLIISEVPEFVKEVIRWAILPGIIKIVFFLVQVFCCYVFGLYLDNFLFTLYPNSKELIKLVTVGVNILLIFAMMQEFYNNVITVIKPITVPRIFLTDYVINLLKKGN